MLTVEAFFCLLGGDRHHFGPDILGSERRRRSNPSTIYIFWHFNSFWGVFNSLHILKIFSDESCHTPPSPCCPPPPPPPPQFALMRVVTLGSSGCWRICRAGPLSRSCFNQLIWCFMTWRGVVGLEIQNLDSRSSQKRWYSMHGV